MHIILVPPMPLQPHTFQFLIKLRANNDRNWFEANRPAYEQAKQNVEAFAQEMLDGLSKQNAAFANLRPKDCMFRLHRDVRFSKDKSPYKTNMGVYFNPLGKKSDTPGFYFHIEPGKCFAAAGMWMPTPDWLGKIRQEIDYNREDLEQIFKKPAFKKIFPLGFSMGEKLQRPPKGYSPDNPAIEWIKLKSFVVTTPITDSEAMEKTFAKNLLNIFNTASPVNEFLTHAIS